jgi:hypothetical protein
MQEMFDENMFKHVSTCWLPFFGDATAGGSKTLFSPDRNVVDIQIKKAKMSYAKMRLRGIPTDNIGDTIKRLRNERYTSVSRTFPLMEDAGSIGAEQLLDVGFGNNPYMDTTKQQRMRELAVDMFNEIAPRFVSGFNLLAKDSILTGFQPAIFGTTDSGLKYDFLRSTNLFNSPTTEWNVSGATILADIDDMCTRVFREGKLKPDAMFTSGTVINAMINDADFSSLADNRRFNLVGIGSSNKMGENPITTMPTQYNKFVQSGWLYKGWIQTPEGYELHLFVTPDYTQEDNGDVIELMDSDKALICSTQARCDRYFGPSEMLPFTPSMIREQEEIFGISLSVVNTSIMIKNKSALIRPDMFYTHAWRNQGNTNATVRVQSAPIFPTIHTDAFGVLEDLIQP